jgi:ppGpp synthetase/RelA/SpoT-type nucleotidyltranferase
MSSGSQGGSRRDDRADVLKGNDRIRAGLEGDYRQDVADDLPGRITHISARFRNLDIDTPYFEQAREILENYAATRPAYEKLVTRTRVECERLLQTLHIKGVVQGRSKTLLSLEKKLNDPSLNADLMMWVKEKKGSISEHPDMGDFAGVRIGLYFPEDITTVVAELGKNIHFKLWHPFGTVTDGRDATAYPKKDLSEHMQPRWRTQDPDGRDHYWEHSGYKSWQQIIEWNTRPLDGVERPKVEIQVGTVVSQAWAEIQHNVIYKRPGNIPLTPTIERMIDAINGLAITTDIILKELRKGLKEAGDEAGRKTFRDWVDFEDWFNSAHWNQMPPQEQQNWQVSRISAYELVFNCLAEGPSGLIFRHVPCPDTFEGLIERHGLLQMRPRRGHQLDIAKLLKDTILAGSDQKALWREFPEHSTWGQLRYKPTPIGHTPAGGNPWERVT